MLSKTRGWPQTALLTRPKFCTALRDPRWRKTSEESSKRVASEAQGPAGPPEGAVFEGLFGRAKSPPPEAKCPKGRKARAAGPKKHFKKPGPQAQKNILKSPGRRPKKAQGNLKSANLNERGLSRAFVSVCPRPLLHQLHPSIIQNPGC